MEQARIARYSHIAKKCIEKNIKTLFLGHHADDIAETVSMRIVSVQTGEILLSTNVTKTIASHSKGGDVFRFLDMGTKALELETGVAVNEPVNYAIRTAIEFAVLQLVYDGEKQGFWKFKIPDVELHPHNKKMNTEKNGVHK